MKRGRKIGDTPQHTLEAKEKTYKKIEAKIKVLKDIVNNESQYPLDENGLPQLTLPATIEAFCNWKDENLKLECFSRSCFRRTKPGYWRLKQEAEALMDVLSDICKKLSKKSKVLVDLRSEKKMLNVRVGALVSELHELHKKFIKENEKRISTEVERDNAIRDKLKVQAQLADLIKLHNKIVPLK